MKKKPTKQVILDNAIALFKEKGYHQVKIEEICAVSHITKSTFYYYFKAKDDLLEEFNHVASAYAEETFNQLLTSSNYVKQLWNFYKISLTPTLNAGVEITSQLLTINMEKDQHYFAPGEYSMWKTEILLIKKAQELNQIKNHEDAQKIAEALVYAMEGTTLVWCIKKGNFDLTEKIKEAFATILQIEEDFKNTF